MDQVYGYVCLKTHRVFRIVPFDSSIPAAKQEDVLIVRTKKSTLDSLISPAWVWGRGFYTDTQVLPQVQLDHLKLLDERCLALESLYRYVSLWRQNYTLNIPFNDLAEEFLYEEALSHSETSQKEDLPLLWQYGRAHNLDLRAAAQLALLSRDEKRACIVSTELFKIEWEARLLNSNSPLFDLELMKEAYPMY